MRRIVELKLDGLRAELSQIQFKLQGLKSEIISLFDKIGALEQRARPE